MTVDLARSPHTQIHTASRRVLAVGFYPSGVPTPGIEIVPTTPAIAAAWGAGDLVLQENGAVTVTPFTPPPARRSAILEVLAEDIRTTNGTQTTLIAWPLAVQTLYAARFTLTAIDVGNADCRVWTAKATAKRVNGGALLVGTPTLETSHADAGAASWAVAADVSGNDFRVRVTGAAGRTISWSLLGEVIRSRPDGLVD